MLKDPVFPYMQFQLMPRSAPSSSLYLMVKANELFFSLFTEGEVFNLPMTVKSLMGRIPDEDYHYISRLAGYHESKTTSEFYFKKNNRWYKPAFGELTGQVFSVWLVDVTHEKQLIDRAAAYPEKGRLLNDRVLLNPKGIIMDINLSLAKMFGYEKSEIIGKKILDMVHPDDHPGMEARLLRDHHTPFEVRVLGKNGDLFFVEADGRKIEAKNKTLLVFSVKNLTEIKRLEHKVTRTEEKYQRIIENSYDIFYQLSPEGIFTYVSPAWTALLGHTPEEVTGQSFTIFVHPDDLAYCNSVLQKALETGKRFEGAEYRVKHKNGEWRWHTTSATPETNEKGIIGFYAIARDITAQRKAEQLLTQNANLLHSVLESQRDMICQLDKDICITYVNKAFASFFNKDPRELTGVEWDSLFTSYSKADIHDLIGKMEEDSSMNIIFQQKVFSLQGIKRWHEWKGYALTGPEGEVTGFQFTGYDITDLIERKELEKDVEIARNTIKFKQNFLASMSHEIRTPLIGILGMAELLNDTNLDLVQKDFLETLNASIDSLKQIIDHVLDYSSIESGNLQLVFAPSTLSDIISQSQSFFRGICKKNIRFSVFKDETLPELLVYDHGRVMQIVLNLITNAVKFTESGNVDLRIHNHTSGKQGMDEILVKIEVTDTGIGIREERQSSIFSPFSQVHHIDTEKYSGLGIGLSICKEIAEMHGGEIGLLSHPGKGSTVWFTFRAVMAKPEHTNAEGRKTSVPGEVKSLKILYVEDKEATQKVIKIQLNAMGHHVTLANNGKEALEANDPCAFDLILMDIQMPVMDGLTATRIIREKYPDHPPIVGLSANSFDGDREKYMTLGMDDYLRKPATREDFERIFKKFFGS